MAQLTWSEAFNLWALAAVAACWVFVFGATLGSFLNVVVYRLPRGMPLVMSLSRCPKCANPISARDNIPILSWMLLRGRCRACGQEISVRYPLVEAAVGVLFVLIAYLELPSGGANLPGFTPRPTGISWLLTDPSWRLVAITCCHCCLMYLLLGIVLIEADRRIVPWKLAAAGILLGAPAAWFFVTPFSTDHWADWAADSRILQAFFTGAGGLVAGAAVGAVHAWLPPSSLSLSSSAGRRSRRACAARALYVSMTWVGLFMGWQAAVVIGLAVGIVRMVAMGLGAIWPRIRRIPSSFYVAALTLLHIALWRWIAEISNWIAPRGVPLLLLAISATLLALFPLLSARTSASAG